MLRSSLAKGRSIDPVNQLKTQKAAAAAVMETRACL
jgi:hypothetical protein